MSRCISRTIDWAIALLPAAAFVTAVILIIPFGTVFEFDRDEGLNVMKAALFKEGMPLYSTIWSDQPPLLTVALANLFKITGNSILAARALVLTLSGIGLISLAALVRMTAGRAAAVAAVLLLVLTNEYIRLSVAVMIGLPALSLALASIALAFAGARRGSWLLLGLSGVVMGMSMQIKLFSFMSVPWVLLFVGVMFRRRRAPESSDSATPPPRQVAVKFAAIGTWLAGFAIVFVTVGLYFGLLNYDQLVGSHLRARVEAVQIDTTPQMLRRMAGWDWDQNLLAGLGLVGAVVRRRWIRLFPACWFFTAVAIMSNHKPIWDDHYPLFAIPLAWLGAYAVADALDALRAAWRFRHVALRRVTLLRATAALPAIAVLAVIASHWPEKSARWSLAKMPHVDRAGSAKVLQEMRRRGTTTGWVFTDRPIYAFLAGRRVPPEVAVISAKRFHSEVLTRADLIALVERYRPDQIVLARFLRTDIPFRFWLLMTHSKELDDRGAMLFVPRERPPARAPASKPAK